MAGAFAHIALVDSLCQDARARDSIATLTLHMNRALMTFNNFCELGAISPDAPYLTPLSSDASAWANVMHYWKTVDFVRRAIPRVNAMDSGHPDTQKCLAWLFGYTAHLVTDFTVHPVLNIKVGSYAENSLKHRICEMNQDVYIFDQRGLGKISTAEFLKSRSGGIASCADQADEDKLDPAIRNLWCHCLEGYPLASIKMKDGLPAPQSPPDPDTWFDYYVLMIDKFAEEGNRTPWLCRQLVEIAGLVYPQEDEVDQSFIQNLELPDGTTANYDAVFERARQNVIATWRDLGDALDKGDPSLLHLSNGDLDTGEADDTHQSIFWKTTV